MNENFKIEKKLGITFKNPKLLESALTHSSLRFENENLESNEILEFVGDSIMYFIITVYLYKNLRFNENSGKFSIIRSNIISNQTFTKFAKKIKLEKYINVSKGQNKVGITDSMLSNCFEALIGAIYIDGGYKSSIKFIKMYWGPYLNVQASNLQDPKTKLQEISQHKFKKLPVYKLIKKHGSSHSPTFTVSLKVLNLKQIKSRGTSIREAEKNAALVALEMFNASKTS